MLLFLLIWLGFGLITLVVCILVDLSNEIDLTINGIFSSLGLALLGPLPIIALLLALGYDVFGNLEDYLKANWRKIGEQVVIKASKKAEVK